MLHFTRKLELAPNIPRATAEDPIDEWASPWEILQAKRWPHPKSQATNKQQRGGPPQITERGKVPPGLNYHSLVSISHAIPIFIRSHYNLTPVSLFHLMFSFLVVKKTLGGTRNKIVKLEYMFIWQGWKESGKFTTWAKVVSSIGLSVQSLTGVDFRDKV